MTWKSVRALLAGFVLVVALSLGTDMGMHALGFFPAFGEPVGEGALAVALVYRTLFDVGGSYLTAMLAPNRPMYHSMLSGAVGFVLSVIGAAATWNGGPAFGPKWYPLGLVATALPAAWAGGRVYLSRRGAEK